MTTDAPTWLANYQPTEPQNRWKKGQSGNPAGRPKGSKNYRTELAAFQDEGAAIAQVVIDKAKDGDLTACGLVLARLAPPLRARAQKVAFDLDPAAPLTDQAQAVLTAVAAGDVDPETGKLLIDCISSFGGLRQVDELAARLAAIEERMQPTARRA